MNLTELKDKLTSSFSTLSLACISIITNDELLSGVTAYSAIFLAFFTAYAEFNLKRAQTRKIDAETNAIEDK